MTEMKSAELKINELCSRLKITKEVAFKDFLKYINENKVNNVSFIGYLEFKLGIKSVNIEELCEKIGKPQEELYREFSFDVMQNGRNDITFCDWLEDKSAKAARR